MSSVLPLQAPACHVGAARRIALWCVAAALALSYALLSAIPAWAADDPDLQDAPDWVPAVTLSADSAGLADGQVRLSAEGVNDSGYATGRADLSLALPEGLVVVDGSISVTADSLDAGASLSLQAVVAQEGSAAASTPVQSGGAPLAGTGDVPVALLVAAVALAAIVLVALAWRHRRAATRAMSVLLAVCLAVGLAPLVPGTALADEGGSPVTQGSASASFPLAGTEYEASATMAVYAADGADEEEAAEASLSTETYVAAGAASAHVTLASDAAFADNVDASLVTFDGGLAGWVATQVERVDDTTLALTIEGPAVSADAADGSVFIDGDAFADSPEGGWGIIAVVDPEPLIEEADVSAGQGYDADAGLFVLPVSLGAGEFSAGASRDDFSLPANGAIAVEGVSCAAGDRKALVSLRVPGADATAQFEALDAALTEGGIAIGADATNCGALTAVSDAVASAPDDGHTTTALEYVDATLVASARATGVEGSSADGHSLGLVRFQAHLATMDGGAVDLLGGEGSLSFDCELPESGGAGVGTLEVVDDATVAFVMGLGDDHLAVLEELVDDLDGDGTLCTSDFQGCQDAYDELACLLAAFTITVRGEVTNKWGIPQRESTAYLLYDYADDAYDDSSDPAAAANGALATNAAAVSAVSAGSAGQAARAVASNEVENDDLQRYETASHALEACNEALRAIGEFINAAKEGQVGDWFTGAGSVLGFIANVLEGIGSEPYTLEDVIERLDTIQESLNSIERQVSGLSSQLDAVEARSEYRTYINQLLTYCSTLTKGTASLVENTAGKLDKGSTSAAKSFAELSENDQSVLRNLATATDAYAKGRNHTTLELVSGLGDLLLGQSAIGASGVAELYYRYVDTYYNWESETYLARQEFLAYVSSAYIYGYTAAMCELNVAYADADSEGQREGIKQSMDDLLDQAKQVAALLAGTEDAKGNWTDAQLVRDARGDDGASLALNLVTGTSFTTQHFDSGIAYPTDRGLTAVPLVVCSGAQANLDKAFADRNVDLLKPYTLKTDITGAQFQEMARRLAALAKQRGYTGPTTIADELISVGVPYGDQHTWHSKNGALREARGESSAQQASRFVVSVNPNRIVTVNKANRKHAYAYTGDVFDITTNSVVSGVHLVDYYRQYKASKVRWKVDFTYYDYKVAIAE